MKRIRRDVIKKTLLRETLSLVLSLSMILGLVPGGGMAINVHAKTLDKEITGLGIGAITDPVAPESKDSAWSGNYVYFGNYNGQPVKYRVLDAETDRFGGNTIFLDCDSTLFKAQFKENYSAQDANQWSASDLRSALNTNENSFLNTGFNEVERNAIAKSTVSEHAIDENLGKPVREYFPTYTALDDKIFLLDFEDVLNKDYGYYPDCGYDDDWNFHTVDSHKKRGCDSYWWLRSPDSRDSRNVGPVDPDGDVSHYNVDDVLGVSPAFNVNLSSVIFSSLIPSGIAAGSPGAEYKLTLKDGGLSIETANGGTRNASGVVSIPYTIVDNSSSAKPTQVSVVVTDGTWTESGWSDGADLLQYEKLAVETLGTSGTGTFTLDSSISGTWGTDYHVYILAEDVNGERETDYASAPVEIKAVTASATGYEGTYDGQAHGISVSITNPTSGAIVKYGESADSCTSETCPTITSVSDSPKIVYYQIEAKGYLTAKGSAVVTINKAEPTVTPPTAKNLNYTGSAQALVTAGKATDGEMQYALGDANGATQPYSTSIPTATNAGTYYVWYKVVTDENHTDSEPECIKVTIAKKEETDTSIETEVIVSEDAPAVKVDNLNEELVAELLSDEEKEAYNQGTPVLAYLDVKTLAKADVPAIDLEAVEKVTKKDDYTYGECLDFSLWKKLGDAEPTQIHDTNGKPIKLTITIPDTMKSAPDGYTRTFRIIRVHDGVATVMAEGTGATLEVSSDKFSSYFLVYKDTKEAVTTEATTATSTTEATTAASTTEAATAASTSDATTAASATEAAKTSPKTGDSVPIAVLIMFMLSAAGALVYIDLKKKKN